MFFTDMSIVLRVYLISLVIQLLTWPVTKKLFGKMPDGGWALGRVFVSLFAAVVIWQLSYLGLSSNNSNSIFALMAIFGLAGLWQLYVDGFRKYAVSRAMAKIIAIEEYLFVIGLGLVSFIRGHAPELNSLEKYMDFGFVKQYLVSPSLPAMDMWQAGKSINYYSFGHFWTSTLVRVWGVEPSVGYNLMLAFIFGVSMSLVFILCYTLMGKKSSRALTFGSLIGSLSVMVAGNSHVIWYLLKNRGFLDYWYADATRFIGFTIHEFPSYSFVVSDLHGHVLDLPVVLSFLVLLVLWFGERKKIYEVLMGVLFGVMMMTNTWDVAIFGLVMVVMAVLMLIENPREIKTLLSMALTMIVTVFLVTLPWWLSFHAISDGIGLVKERSPFWQLLVLWSGGVVISVLGFVMGKGEKNKLLIRTLALCSIILIAIPEFIYARDIYPDYPRANTMFKLTYQSFIMMGVLAGFAWGKLLDKNKKMHVGVRSLGLFVLLYIFVGTMIFPVKAFPAYYKSFANYKGLSGEKWMLDTMPENYFAAKYLDKNRDGKNMVEAVGHSYTLFNAVSVYSGVPTVQGWRVHEWLWRGGYDTVLERQDDVSEIYQGESVEKAQELLRKYNVGWILIGQNETVSYKINEEKLWLLGEKVWQDGSTYIIKVELPY